MFTSEYLLLEDTDYFIPTKEDIGRVWDFLVYWLCDYILYVLYLWLLWVCFFINS